MINQNMTLSLEINSMNIQNIEHLEIKKHYVRKFKQENDDN